MSRADLTSRIPEFITIAESRINRKLRIRQQETSSDVALTASTRTASLPSDFREVRRFYINGSPVRELEYMAAPDYWRRYAASEYGTPEVFTIEGSSFLFGPIPDTAYTAKLSYYASFPALSSTAHGMFTTNPDLYLYGSLVAAEPYLKNDKRLPIWKAQFDEVLREMETENRTNAGPMRMRDDYNPL